MSGETEEEPSAWTIDSLHQHLIRLADERDKRYEQRFVAQESATKAALAASDKATTKAEAAAEKRFDGVNEFRAALSDQASRLMPRAETENRLSAQSDRISDITRQLNLIQGRSSGIEGAWGYLVGAVGLIGAIVGLVLGLR